MNEGPLHDAPLWDDGERTFVLPLEQVLWDADRQVKRTLGERHRLRRVWMLVIFFFCLEAAALFWILWLGNEYLSRMGR